MDMIMKAMLFATRAHKSINQKRKYTGEDYIVHPRAVVKILLDNVPGITEEQLAAAWLHDVVEDTPVTLQEVRDEFGINVAALVSDLTDISVPEDGSRVVRKRIDRIHTCQASPLAKTVKLADLIHNSESILEHDLKFAKIYIMEKELMLGVLNEGDSKLWTIANEIVQHAKVFLAKV